MWLIIITVIGTFNSKFGWLLGVILKKLVTLPQNTPKAGLTAPFALRGRSEEYNPIVREVADLCMERGWRSLSLAVSNAGEPQV